MGNAFLTRGPLPTATLHLRMETPATRFTALKSGNSDGRMRVPDSGRAPTARGLGMCYRAATSQKKHSGAVGRRRSLDVEGTM